LSDRAPTGVALGDRPGQSLIALFDGMAKLLSSIATRGSPRLFHAKSASRSLDRLGRAEQADSVRPWPIRQLRNRGCALCPLESVWASYPACINAGTTTGAPLLDFDGQTRDAEPDVGPDEYVPVPQEPRRTRLRGVRGGVAV